jgi:hypothetical protein
VAADLSVAGDDCALIQRASRSGDGSIGGWAVADSGSEDFAKLADSPNNAVGW